MNWENRQKHSDNLLTVDISHQEGDIVCMTFRMIDSMPFHSLNLNSSFSYSIMQDDTFDSFSEYQRHQKRTAGPRSNLINAVLGLCGESGEVADIVKKHEFQGHVMDREKLIEELGDVLWYLSEAARSIDVDLADIAKKNIHKLSLRYPDGFSEQRSIFRDE